MLSIKNIFAVVSATTLVFLASTTASLGQAYNIDPNGDPHWDPNSGVHPSDPIPNQSIPEPTSVLGIIAVGGLMAATKKSKNKKQ